MYSMSFMSSCNGFFFLQNKCQMVIEAKHCFIEVFIGKVAANIIVDSNNNISREKKFFWTPNLQLRSNVKFIFDLGIFDFWICLHCQICWEIVPVNLERVFSSSCWSTNGQLTEILTAGEGCKNTEILSIKLLLRETSGEVCKNNPISILLGDLSYDAPYVLYRSLDMPVSR